MSYNLNKSPQPFGGARNKEAPSPFRPASASPLPGQARPTPGLSPAPGDQPSLVLRRQLNLHTAGSASSSPCPSPAGRLRPHSIALSSDYASSQTTGYQGNLFYTFFPLFFLIYTENSQDSQVRSWSVLPAADSLEHGCFAVGT